MKKIIIIPLAITLIFGCDAKDNLSGGRASINIQCSSLFQKTIEKKTGIENKNPTYTIHIKGSQIQVSVIRNIHKAKDVAFLMTDNKIDITYKSDNEIIKDGSYSVVKLNIDRYTGMMTQEWTNYFKQKNSSQFNVEGPTFEEFECAQINEKKF